MHDVHAQDEDTERPPRVVLANRQQRLDCAQAADDDPEDPAERTARPKREARYQLKRPEDDQNPSERVEVVEYEPRVVDEDVGVVERADPINNIERPHDQQQGCRKHRTSSTSHSQLLSVIPLCTGETQVTLVTK